MKETKNLLASKPMLTPVFWSGWIEEFDDREILCILRKKYNLDKELTMKRRLLSKEQNKMVCEGLIIQYDIANNKIQMMTATNNWC